MTTQFLIWQWSNWKAWSSHVVFIQDVTQIVLRTLLWGKVDIPQLKSHSNQHIDQLIAAVVQWHFVANKSVNNWVQYSEFNFILTIVKLCHYLLVSKIMLICRLSFTSALAQITFMRIGIHFFFKRTSTREKS